MLPTQIYNITLVTGESENILVTGNYFKILSATGTVTIKADFGRLENLISGQGLEKTPFDRLLVTNTSGAANTLRLLIGDENFIDGMSGSIEVSKNRAPISTFTNTAATVTNASASLLAAKVGRQYLLIQNKDNAGQIFVNFGAAATLANGIRIPPGGNFELNSTITEQQIFAIGDAASNANVLTVEG